MEDIFHIVTGICCKMIKMMIFDETKEKSHLSLMAEQSLKLLLYRVEVSTSLFSFMEYLIVSEHFHTTSCFGPFHIYNHDYK